MARLLTVAPGRRGRAVLRAVRGSIGSIAVETQRLIGSHPHDRDRLPAESTTERGTKLSTKIKPPETTPRSKEGDRLIRLLRSNDLKKVQKARNEIEHLRAKKERSRQAPGRDA